MSARPRAVERPTGSAELLVPITLELSPIRRLLIIDIAGDPTYRTLEPQMLDGASGAVLVLLAYRLDGYVELYVPPACDLDSSGYDGLGKGVLGIHQSVFQRARFEVTDDGLQLDLVLAAPNGRRFDLQLHERLAGPRDSFAVLAPVGSAFDAPTFFPFLWLPALSFVPVRGTEAVVRVDGAVRTIPRLPLPIGGRRCLMARYDPAVQVCQVNPAGVSEPVRVPARGTAPNGHSVEVVEVDEGYGLAAVRVGRDGHTCGALLQPPMPDPRSLAEGTPRSGAFVLHADGRSVLRGRYELARTGHRVRLVIEGFGPWRARPRRLLLALLFRLPVFRRWPTTYRWEATLDLSAPVPRLTSRWSRCPAR